MIAERCSTCGQEGATSRLPGLCMNCLAKSEGGGSPLGLRENDRFGPLEIVKRLGQGGMGIVYKARQPQLDRFVALKVLSPSLSADPEFRGRFNLEAQVLAKLSHPNIVSVYDFGEREGLDYLVMEYVEGVTLREILQNRDLYADDLLRLVPPLCEAIEYAHSQGVVHRDIKPENILVDRRGRLKITDFGLAKIKQAGRRITRVGVVMGTLDYMAPEQRETPETVDNRADVYSLGAVLYELLTGRVPAEKFVRPSRLAPIDPRMDRIVQRALARRPDRRTESATAIRTEVTQVLETPRSRRRIGLYVYLLGACMAIALAAVLGLLLPSPVSPPSRDQETYGVVKALDIGRNKITVLTYSKSKEPVENTYGVSEDALIQFNEDAPVKNADQGRKLSEVPLGAHVRLAFAGESGAVVRILASGGVQSGILKSASGGSVTISIPSKGAPDQEKTFELASGVRIRVDEAKGSKDKSEAERDSIDAVPPGAHVTLELSPDGRRVVLVRAEGETVKGYIDSVDPAAGTLCLIMRKSKDGSDDERKSFDLKAVRIAIEDGLNDKKELQEASLGELRQGLVVVLKQSADQKHILYARVQTPSAQGHVSQVDPGTGKLTLVIRRSKDGSDDETKTFDVKEARILLEEESGKKAPPKEGRLADLAAGMRAVVGLSLDGTKVLWVRAARPD